MELELAGKVALITGAARGIGKGIALVLAEKGADIVLNDKYIDIDGEALASQIRTFGRRVLTVEADVSKADEVGKLFQAIRDRFGKLDILVNNAGTSQAKDIFAATEKDWHYILDTNLTSCFLCSKEAMGSGG
jgi:3-oxoacyl-[acyl-carrier protein] reductase